MKEAVDRGDWRRCVGQCVLDWAKSRTKEGPKRPLCSTMVKAHCPLFPSPSLF